MFEMHLVTNRHEALRALALLRASHAAPLSMDIETYTHDHNGDALDPSRGDIRILSIAPPDGAPILFDLRALGYNGLPWADLFADRELIAHDAAFELAWFSSKLGVLPRYWFDTFIAAKLIHNGDTPHNDLGSVLDTYLGIKLHKTLGTSDWGAWFLVEEQLRYAMEDVVHLGALRTQLIKSLDAEGLRRCFEIERRLLPIVTQMSLDGMPANRARLDKPPDAITKDERQIAKSAAFGLVYGAGAQGLRNYAKATYGIDLSLKHSQQIRNKFFEYYSGLREWHRDAHANESRVTQGRTVTGRRRLLHTSMSGDSDDINWNAFQLQTNFRVQGSAANVLKSAMIKVAECIPAGAKLRATVHDELILSAPVEIAEETLKAVRQAMTEAFSELFPEVPIELEGKVCSNWSEK